RSRCLKLTWPFSSRWIFHSEARMWAAAWSRDRPRSVRSRRSLPPPTIRWTVGPPPPCALVPAIASLTTKCPTLSQSPRVVVQAPHRRGLDSGHGELERGRGGGAGGGRPGPGGPGRPQAQGAGDPAARRVAAGERDRGQLHRRRAVAGDDPGVTQGAGPAPRPAPGP